MRAGLRLLALLGVLSSGLVLTGCGGGGAAPTSIEVTPASLRLAAGSQQRFSVTTRAAAGDRAATPVWQCDPQIGSIDQSGLFTATTSTSSTTPVSGAVSVTTAGLTGRATVTVVLADLERLQIELPDGSAATSLEVGTPYQLTAVAADRFGNRSADSRVVVTPAWSVQGPAWIDASGRLLPTGVASFEVTATYQGLTVTLPAQGVGASDASATASQVLSGGESATLSAAGLGLAASHSGSSPAAVVLEAVAPAVVTPAEDLPGVLAPTAARVSFPLGPPTGNIVLTVPKQPSESGTVLWPATLLDGRPMPVPRDRLTEFADRFEIALPASFGTPPAAAGRGWALQLPKIGLFKKRVTTWQYQLGPLVANGVDMHTNWVGGPGHDDRLEEGYGRTGSRGQRWPQRGRVALVIHGLMSNPGTWLKDEGNFVDFLQDSLHYQHVWAFHYNSFEPVAGNAQILAELLGAAAVPDEGVDIFAHSMGGLVARYAIERLGQGPRVLRLVTIGTPHRGTIAATHQGLLDAWFSDAQVWQPTGVFASEVDLVPAASAPGGLIATLSQAPAQRVPTVYYAVASDSNGVASAMLDVVRYWSNFWSLEIADLQLLNDLQADGDGIVHLSSALAVRDAVQISDWNPAFDPSQSFLSDHGGLLPGAPSPVPLRVDKSVHCDHLQMTANGDLRQQISLWWRVNDVPVTVH